MSAQAMSKLQQVFVGVPRSTPLVSGRADDMVIRVRSTGEPTHSDRPLGTEKIRDADVSWNTWSGTEVLPWSRQSGHGRMLVVVRDSLDQTIALTIEADSGHLGRVVTVFMV